MIWKSESSKEKDGWRLEVLSLELHKLGLNPVCAAVGFHPLSIRGKRRERECRSTREAIRFAGKLLQSVLTELTDTLEEESSGCSSDCRDGQEEG